MDWTQYALRRTLPGAEHGRRPPVEAVAMSAFLFHVFFTFGFFFFSIFYILVTFTFFVKRV